MKIFSYIDLNNEINKLKQMTQNCYICDQIDDIVLYYNLKPVMYIDPKMYTKSINDNLKPICEKCLIPFVFKRQLFFNICAICKCYNKYPGGPPEITENCTEIHSNVVDGNFKFNSSEYPYLKDGDLLCKNCFEDIISKPETQKIIYKDDCLDDKQCSQCKIMWKDAIFPKDTDVMSWAYFKSDNIFEYGWLGQFKITSENVNFKKGDHICNDCLKTIKYENNLTIECEICHKKYRSLGHGMKGDGCAAYIYDTIISGGFGSKYDSMSDSEAVRFKIERPKNLLHGALICDNCIDELIENGTCLKPVSYQDDDDIYSVPIKMALPNEENMNEENMNRDNGNDGW